MSIFTIWVINQRRCWSFIKFQLYIWMCFTFKCLLFADTTFEVFHMYNCVLWFLLQYAFTYTNALVMQIIEFLRHTILSFVHYIIKSVIEGDVCLYCRISEINQLFLIKYNDVGLVAKNEGWRLKVLRSISFFFPFF